MYNLISILFMFNSIIFCWNPYCN